MFGKGGQGNCSRVTTTKSKINTTNLKIMEIVLLKMKTFHLQNGTEEELWMFIPGSDGVVRTVTIRRVNGLTRVTVSKLWVL